MEAKKHHIFIVSDGTGRTADQALEAALTQFAEVAVEIEVRPGMRSEDQILRVVKEAVDADGFIVHTMVSRKLREAMLQSGRLYNIETIDLMGPLLAQLSVQFTDLPSEKPGLFHKLNKAYFQRIEAMEFAFRHDDGQRVDEINKAEIVLIGVSRTFKTPLSVYFAFKGWLVANVPIVMYMEPPAILNDLPPERVFCLTTNPNQLSRLRQVRHQHLGGATGDYVDPEIVRLELMHARRIFGEHPNWPVINVTNKPIEEIASEILEILRKVQ